MFVLGLVFGFQSQFLIETRFKASFGLWFTFRIGMWLVIGLAVGLGIWVAVKAHLRTPVRWRLVFERPAMMFALGLGLGAAVYLVTAEFLGGHVLGYGLGLIALLGVVLGLRFGLGWSSLKEWGRSSPFLGW